MIFKYKGFTLAYANLFESDARDVAREWTQANQEFAGLRSKFWFTQTSSVESFILKDRFGIVLYFQFATANDAVEVHMLFPPVPETAEKRLERSCRVRRGIMEVFPLIEKALALRPTKEIYFKSKSIPLIRFSEKRLGFRNAGIGERDEYKIVKAIAA